tara:strand:+ start:331 stop:444 length:114 start_codon:yes stop_codon:yes gene_type:complete
MRDQEVDNTIDKGYDQKSKRESMWCIARKPRDAPKAH